MAVGTRPPQYRFPPRELSLVRLSTDRALSPEPEVLPDYVTRSPSDRPRPCPRLRLSSPTFVHLMYTSITPREARGPPRAITGVIDDTAPGVIRSFHRVCCGLVKQVAYGLSIVIADLSLRYCPGMVVVIVHGHSVRLPERRCRADPQGSRQAPSVCPTRPPASLALCTRGPCAETLIRASANLLFSLVGLAVDRALSPEPEVLPDYVTRYPSDRPRPCPRLCLPPRTFVHLMYTSITSRKAR